MLIRKVYVFQRLHRDTCKRLVSPFKDMKSISDSPTRTCLIHVNCTAVFDRLTCSVEMLAVVSHGEQLEHTHARFEVAPLPGLSFEYAEKEAQILTRSASFEVAHFRPGGPIYPMPVA